MRNPFKYVGKLMIKAGKYFLPGQFAFDHVNEIIEKIT